jgi:tetratricopeptide (TPR) repeat protein
MHEMAAWSKRDVNRLREQMNAQGRDLDEIANEIRHLSGCSRLAAYRMAIGWSQPEAVEHYCEVAQGSVLDQPLLSRMEQWPASGSRPPLAAQIITLATVYGTTPLRLLDPKALDRLDAHERAVLVRCSTAFESLPAVRTGEVGYHEDSRQPMFAVNESLERKVEMAARRALRFAVTAEGSNVGPETLDQLRDEVARSAAAYPQQPLPQILGDLMDLQDVAFRLLEGRQRPSESHDLYLMAGALSGMLAKASHDLGDPHSAMTQARTAYICADNAGHNGLRMWTRGLQSMIAYWAGWPNEAVRYTRLLSENESRSRGTVSVWLAAQEARVLAVLGETDQAEDAIRRANVAREKVEPDDLDELGGILTFTRPRQLYYEADARVWLPGEEAEAAAIEAIAAYESAAPEERSFSDEAGASADLALARVNRGELEGAREALRPVLDLSSEQRIGGILASVLRVHGAVRNQGYGKSAAGRDMQQEIEGYCQVHAAAILPRGR